MLPGCAANCIKSSSAWQLCHVGCIIFSKIVLRALQLIV